MEDIKKNAWLLSIIGILLVLKLIVVPIIDWQDGKIAEIRLLANKQYKIDSVLAREDGNSQLVEKLSSLVEQGDAYFWPIENESEFKLATQRFIQEQLNKYNLRMINIGVEQHTEFQDLNVVQYPVKVRFTGDTPDAISFFMSLESNTKRLSIETFSLSMKGQNEENLGSSNGSALVMFYAYESTLSNRGAE